jgi:hypothetical protein
MIPDDQVDRWLRTAMAAPPPTLRAGFDRDVARAVVPRRLPARSRAVIAAYAAVAIATVALVLPAAAVPWPVTALCAVLPFGALAAPGLRGSRPGA